MRHAQTLGSFSRTWVGRTDILALTADTGHGFITVIVRRTGTCRFTDRRITRISRAAGCAGTGTDRLMRHAQTLGSLARTRVRDTGTDTRIALTLVGTVAVVVRITFSGLQDTFVTAAVFIRLAVATHVLVTGGAVPIRFVGRTRAGSLLACLAAGTCHAGTQINTLVAGTLLRGTTVRIGHTTSGLFDTGMIGHLFTRPAGQCHACVATALLRRSTVRIGRTIPGDRRTRIVLTLLARTTVRIRSTTARFRHTLMILRFLTHRRTRQGNTRIIHTFFIGSTGRITGTVSGNRRTRIVHTCVAFRTSGIIRTPARNRLTRPSGTTLPGFTGDVLARIRRVTPANPVRNLRPRTTTLVSRRTGLA